MVSSPTIKGISYEKLKELVAGFAKRDYPVLLIGETGTGKVRAGSLIFARYFMYKSKRKGDQVTVNCASFEDALLRSELFGHKKGAFIGAVSNKEGRLQSSDKSILFLDELGDASQQMQAAIVRVVEGNGYSRVAEDIEKQIDVLIIAAKNKPRRVREDLKHRFIILYVQPLQKIDIPALVQHFMGNRLSERF